MRVYLCDPGLLNETGHHASLNGVIAAEFRRRDIEVRLLAHQRINPDLAQSLEAEPLFSIYPYEKRFVDPLTGWLENFLTGAAAIAADLRRLDCGPGDLMLWHSTYDHQLLGIADWLRGHSAPPVVAMLFGSDAGLTRDGTPKSAPTTLFRYAVKQLPDNGRVFLAAQDEAPARNHQILFDRHVAVFPCPYDGKSRYRRRGQVLGFVGHQRVDKGLHLIPAIARALLSPVGRDLRLLVHNSGMNPDFTEPADILRGLGALVLHQSISAREWEDVLDTCDALIVPYDPDSGAAHHSSIVTEAVSHGIPLVVPAATGVADFAHRWGAGFETFDAWTPDSIAAATFRLLDRFAEHAASSYLAAQRWQTSQGVAAFADHLLSLVGSGEAGR